MNALNYEVLRNTEKLYYKDQYLAGASTQVTRVHSDGIELQSTVAYPEGGGQEADVGTIELPIGTVRFVWVKKTLWQPYSPGRFQGRKTGRHHYSQPAP